MGSSKMVQIFETKVFTFEPVIGLKPFMKSAPVFKWI